MAAPAHTFQPRTALVTGAAQGIGRAIALRLADDGLDIAVNDIPTQTDALAELVAAIRAKGRRAVAVVADVSREAEVQEMVAQAVQAFDGILDVMVANAGIAIVAPITEIDVEQWDTVMAVNARGTMLCYKHAARHLIKQGTGGRIIGASSIFGKRGAMGVSPYASTKGVVRTLTQCAALELAEHNITVNAYAPGIINTALLGRADSISDEADAVAGLKKILGNENVGIGEPEVVASVVSYLVKPEAYFITGQAISMDGGINFQ